MRRYDTFTQKAKTAFFKTVEIAEVIGYSNFICQSLKYSLRCSECPRNGACKPSEDKTASDWLAWASEELEDGNNNANE